MQLIKIFWARQIGRRVRDGKGGRTSDSLISRNGPPIAVSWVISSQYSSLKNGPRVRRHVPGGGKCFWLPKNDAKGNNRMKKTTNGHVPFQKIGIGNAGGAAEIECAFATASESADNEDLGYSITALRDAFLDL